jgi:hypothetical protein
MSLDEILSEAIILPVEAKAILAEQLIESIGADIESQVSSYQLAEVKRRRDELRSGKIESINGEEALAKVRDLVTNYRRSR